MKARDLREGTCAAALGGWTALVFLFVFAPIVSTVVFSFNADRFPSLPWGGFSLAWYAAVLTDDSVRRSLVNSLIVAAAAAAIATVLGFAAAYVDYRFRFFGKRTYMALASLPPTVPVVILGVAMLTFEGRIGLSGTLAGVVAGHVVLCSPFAMALVRMRLADLDPDLEPAAWNLGANAWTSLREIVIPFALPAILASLFITAAVSFDEYMIAWFVSGLNETLPVRVLAMLQGQVSPRINAVGSLVFAVSAILVVLAQILTRRKV
ncbi:MAG: binding-protein-dependent transport system inner rane component [Bradyrhizobium sp.]|nr:binding-protein-dependent transport system inner rane component [Bradyrhizobium sp.]